MLNKLSVYCLKYAESELPENMVFTNGDKGKVVPISFAYYLIKTKNKNILVDTGCNDMPGFVLRQMDLSVEDITDVIITHSHHDHIEAVKYFRNANVYISKEEYENGKCYLSNNVNVNVFENESIINGQIKIIKWGGHSKGSSIVEIKIDDSIHIIAGDECYTNDCIARKIPTGCHCNLEKSKEFIEKYSDKRYSVHTCHSINLKSGRIV